MPQGRLRRAASAICEQLADAPDAATVLDFLLQHGLREIGVSRAVLCLVDRQGKRLVPIGVDNLERREIRRIAGDMTLDRLLPLTEAARTGSSVWVTSPADAHARFPELDDMISPDGAWIALPLRSRGHVFGVLGLAFGHARHFSDADRMFFETVANMTALTLSSQLARGAKPGASLSSATVDRDIERVTVCAWTRLIEVDGAWLTVEDFLVRRLGIDVSHGVHPDVMADIGAGRPVTIVVPVLPVAIDPIDTGAE